MKNAFTEGEGEQALKNIVSSAKNEEVHRMAQRIINEHFDYSYGEQEKMDLE